MTPTAQLPELNNMLSQFKPLGLERSARQVIIIETSVSL